MNPGDEEDEGAKDIKKKKKKTSGEDEKEEKCPDISEMKTQHNPCGRNRINIPSSSARLKILNHFHFHSISIHVTAILKCLQPHTSPV